MSGHSCPICSSVPEAVFSQKVLERHEATYLKCFSCGFLWIDRPNWLDEAYESSIADVDTGVLARARSLQPRLATLLRLLGCAPPYLDIGGGYGVLVRSMRDAGFDFRWEDPHTENLLARGFEYDGCPVSAAVAVEVIEHVLDPRAFLAEAIARTRADVVVLTTELLPVPVPSPDWWYFGPETGQHISFFEYRTLGALANAAGFVARSRGNLHVFTRRPIAAWRFLVAATRLANPASALLQRSAVSLTEFDNPLLARRSSG